MSHSKGASSFSKSSYYSPSQSHQSSHYSSDKKTIVITTPTREPTHLSSNGMSPKYSQSQSSSQSYIQEKNHSLNRNNGSLKNTTVISPSRDPIRAPTGSDVSGVSLSKRRVRQGPSRLRLDSACYRRRTMGSLLFTGTYSRECSSR